MTRSEATSEPPKVVRTPNVLYILTSKCASRHNGVHFFEIWTSKSGANMWCFVHFDFEMCFAPQRRALFRELNFQKCSEHGVFCAFWLRNVLRATTACTFSTSQLPKVVRTPQFLTHFTSKCASRHNGVQLFISHLPRCLRTRRFSEPTFQPSGATKPRKNTVFRDFPTFSRTCIFFLLIFSLLTLLPADCFFISPYCRKFDFQISFDYILLYCFVSTFRSSMRSDHNWSFVHLPENRMPHSNRWCIIMFPIQMAVKGGKSPMLRRTLISNN